MAARRLLLRGLGVGRRSLEAARGQRRQQEAFSDESGEVVSAQPESFGLSLSVVAGGGGHDKEFSGVGQAQPLKDDPQQEVVGGSAGDADMALAGRSGNVGARVTGTAADQDVGVFGAGHDPAQLARSGRG